MTVLPNNPLWKYSLSVYEKAGVSTLLIRLQDEFGADVNLLLAACWLGNREKLLSPAQWRDLVKLSASWRGECVMPLRTIRRYLKGQTQVPKFYERVKALELEAEQVQQDLLYTALQAISLQSDERGARLCSQQNIQNYCVNLPGADWSDMAGVVPELLMAVEAEAL